jgi:hypothetical protein
MSAVTAPAAVASAVPLADPTAGAAAEGFDASRFVARVLAGRGLALVAGREGWARLPYRRDVRREVVMFWSDGREAEAWADVVAVEPRVYRVRLGQLVRDVLPMLHDLGCLVGPDWNSEPDDPVIEPTMLVQHIRRAHQATFLDAVRQDETIWMLQSAAGPALLPSLRRVGRTCLPVWSSREAAIGAATGQLAARRPLGASLAAFRDRYLPYLEQRGCLIGPEPVVATPVADGRVVCEAVCEVTPTEFAGVAFGGTPSRRGR